MLDLYSLEGCIQDFTGWLVARDFGLRSLDPCGK